MTTTDIELAEPAAVEPAAPATEVSYSLAETFKLAQGLATAGDLIPKCYQGNPGAVTLALLWSEANGIDPFTAMQGIYPVEGRPFVAASLRTAMASRKGFRFDVVEHTAEVCKIDVYGPDDVEPRGTVKVEITEIPPHKFAKDRSSWNMYPARMLFAQAQRDADAFYVQTAASLLDVAQGVEPDDVGPPPSPRVTVAELTGQPADDSAPAPAPATDTVQPTGEPDEPATETTPEPVAGISEEALRASMKAKNLRVVAVLKVAQEMHPDSSLGTIGDIAANNDAAMDVADWIEQQ